VQTPAISGLVLELCVTALHNYKFEDREFIIRVLMFSKGSVKLTLSIYDKKYGCGVV
jgi:hypothetical protein